MSSPSLPSPFTTNEATRLRIAPSFIGTIVSWLLLGTLVVQIYQYHLHFKQDTWRIKLMVYVLFILELVHTGLVTHVSFEILIIHWGDQTIHFHPPVTVRADPFVDGITGAIVQLFFTYRIWMLGERSIWSRVICFIIACAAVLQMTAAAAAPWTRLPHHDLPGKTERTLLQIWLFTSFAADLLIAAAMTYILQTVKNSLEFRATNDLITKLIRQTVQTGAWTAIFALIAVIFVERANKTGDLFVVPLMILGTIYSNSLLANLNARAFRNKGNPIDYTDYGTEFTANGGDSTAVASMEFNNRSRAATTSAVTHNDAEKSPVGGKSMHDV